MAQLEDRAAGTAVPEAIAAEIESHSIDIIPDSERRGKVRSQFTLWFATNANVFNFVLGGFAILFGLNVFWALIALFVGTLLGMVFTALHAVQGPRLGVPQMIQSRGQFGFYGAVFIFLASILLDVGYLAAQQVVQAQSLADLVSSVSIPVWIIIVTIPAVLLAVFGYHWIHRIQPVLTVLFAGALVAAVILTATSGDSLAKAMGGTHLSSFPIFIAAVGLFFMNMLSWAVYACEEGALRRDVVLLPAGHLRRLAVGGDHSVPGRAGRPGPVPGPDHVRRAVGEADRRRRHLVDRRLRGGGRRVPRGDPAGRRRRAAGPARRVRSAREHG
jgi:MFS family permease